MIISKALLGVALGLAGLALTGTGMADPLSVKAETFRGGLAPRSAAVGLRTPEHANGGLTIELPPLVQARSLPASAPTGISPTQIGIGRDLPVDKAGILDAASLTWNSAVDGGRTTVIRLISPEAQSVRAAFQVYQLPDSVDVRFFSPGDASAQVFSVTGAEINRVLERDRNARDPDQESPVLYWSPVIPGDTLGMELYLPPGMQPSELRIAIPEISHLSMAPLFLPPAPLVGMGGSEPCHQDATCYLEYWGDVNPAVARIIFTGTDGGTYLCTGSLINDQDPNDQIPYFITARHCISTQAEASSLQTYWFFQSQRCMREGSLPDGDNLPNNVKVNNGGATLLAALPETDMTLLRLDAPPPEGTVLVGWDANPVAPETEVVGVHHPAGDLKKMTFFTVRGMGGCMMDLKTDFLSCATEPTSIGTHLLLDMNEGFLEGGSSGSGLFLKNSHQLVGIASIAYWLDTDGTATPSCGDSDFKLFYGRFDLAFSERFHNWLAAPVTPSTCGLQPGSWSYCADPACGPCAEGQGDCDANSECQSGLVCARNVGANHGLSPLADVCQVSDDAQSRACTKTPGSWGYCADPACGPCAAGLGDCDSTAECQAGLVCLENQGASKGFLSTVDICGSGPAPVCPLPVGDWGYCSRLGCGPCGSGQGDCDTDADCASGLVCASNAGAKYGLPADMDVCEAPQSGVCTRQVGDWDYCKDPACGPCAVGQGDCDSNAECAAGLVCDTQTGEQLGLDERLDICVAP